MYYQKYFYSPNSKYGLVIIITPSSASIYTGQDIASDPSMLLVDVRIWISDTVRLIRPLLYSTVVVAGKFVRVNGRK